MTQTGRGKAFEFALAEQLSIVTDCDITDDASARNAKADYDEYGVGGMDRAAAEAVLFLHAMDEDFGNALSIRIQASRRGQAGDARDIVVEYFGGEIGLSAKNNHQAVKHSRLSSTIDFGNRWAGHPVSNTYWSQVSPIFAKLSVLREKRILFKELENKEASIYLPVLTAFEDELRRLAQAHGAKFIGPVFRYIVGSHDFYKVMRRRKQVDIQSFNLNGTLGWGSRWKIPGGIEQIQRKPGSMNTLLVTFTGGWQLAFRIHSASGVVEPSLKFDIEFKALPTSVANHQIRIV